MKKIYLVISILIIGVLTGCSDKVDLGGFTDSTYVHYTPENIMDIFRENIDITIDDIGLTSNEKKYIQNRDSDITMANYRYFGYSTEYQVDGSTYDVGANEYIVNTIEEVLNVSIENKYYPLLNIKDEVLSNNADFIPNVSYDGIPSPDENSGAFTKSLYKSKLYFYNKGSINFDYFLNDEQSTRTYGKYDNGVGLDGEFKTEHNITEIEYTHGDHQSIIDDIENGIIEGFVGTKDYELVKAGINFESIEETIDMEIGTAFYNPLKNNSETLMVIFEKLFTHPNILLLSKDFNDAMLELHVSEGFVFTDEEKALISKQEELIFDYVESTPIMYKDENGDFSGVSYEIFKILEEISDLNFDLQPTQRYNDFHEMWDGIDSGMSDGILNITATPTRKEKYSYIDHFFTYDFVIVGDIAHKDHVFSKNNTIYINTGYVKDYSYIENYFNFNMGSQVQYDNIGELMTAFNNGEIDFAIIPENTFNQLYYEQKRYELMIHYNLETESEASMLLSKDLQDYELYTSILNKVSSVIDTSEIQNRYNYHTNINDEFDKINERNETIIWSITSATLFVGFLLIVIITVKNRLIKASKIDYLTKTKIRGELEKFYNTINKEDYYFVFLDVNNLKDINDVFGHNEGDKRLQAFAHKIETTLKSDVFRVGGDEFVILIDKASSTFDEIKESLDSCIKSNSTFLVGASAGACDLKKYKDKPLSRVMRYVDYELYKVKSSEEKERVSWCNDNTAKEVEEIIEIEDFISQDNFIDFIIPKFQAIVDIDKKVLVGFEALARLSKDGKEIPPDKFLNEVIKKRKILQLDLKMIEESIKTTIKLNENKICNNDIRITSNVSPISLRTLKISTLDKLVKKYKIKKENVFIEITEQILVDNYARDKIKQLTKAGYSLLIDDFTAGHSSVKYLIDLDIKTIKLDRSLLTMKDGQSTISVISLFKDFCDKLNLMLIVEGIENNNDLFKIKTVGTSIVQGYLFSKPVLFEDLEKKDFLKNIFNSL